MADDTSLEPDASAPIADSYELAPEEVAVLDEPDPSPEPVSYSGADFDVDGLVRRLNKGDIVVPRFGTVDPTLETAGFQRRFVWRRPQMDRFIESLLLGYPVPSILLVQQADRRYLVLDGQQRLRTLQFFYGGEVEGSPFVLKAVADRFVGLSYTSLEPELRRTLDNSFVQATIVKTDESPESLEAVYQIFERFNSGGTQLTPHEIRVALYAGPFIEFLTSLNGVTTWRDLYGRESPRLRDQELVLRFVALYTSPGEYQRPLKRFLNEFAGRHRHLEGLQSEMIRSRFDSVTSLLLAVAGPASLRLEANQVNAAFAEAVLVGLARRLDAGTEPAPDAVAQAIHSMRQNTELVSAVSRATADEAAVQARIGIASKAFAAI